MFEGDYADAAAALVEAAHDGQWSFALDLAERAFGAAGAILMSYEGLASQPVAVMAGSAGMRPDRQEDYLRNFAALDVRAAFCARQPYGQIIHDYQMGPIAEVDRTPLYAEFLRPLDLGRFAGVNLGVAQPEGGRSHTYFALAKRNDASPPSAEEALRVMSMGRLARSAVRTAGIVTALRGRAERLRAAIESLDVGVVFLTPGCIVADCNGAGRRLLQESRTLIYQDRRLSFRDQEADARLKRLMRGDLALQPGEMWAARGERDDDGVMIVVAAHLDRGALDLGGSVMTLFLIDPRRQVRDSNKNWKRLFRLTPKECEVAALMLYGMSRREIAEARGVSEATVHVQMRALYGKLHVSKLNDAVLLLRATAGA